MEKLLKIVKYFCIYLILFFVCIIINKEVVIKGLYMDDLFNWSYFPENNLYEYAFKFLGASRYRPFFDALQYIEYIIVGNNPQIFSLINYILNSFVALFIFYFAKKFNVGYVLSFLTSCLYLISHFAYYQIGQALGLLETEALFFAIVILFISFKLVGAFDKENFEKKSNFNYINVSLLILFYFIIAFTHERFLCLLPIIVLAIIFSKNRGEDKTKYRIFSFSILTFVLIAICVIRYLAIGKILPAGTGGSYVEETFNLMECIKFCFTQIAFIFGINIGPEFLVGIEFFNISTSYIKFFGIVSICAILFIFLFYIVCKINIEKKLNSFLIDLLFILAVALCIGASSVTIRVEMRFVYVSFVICLLYMCYMVGYIFNTKKIMPSILIFVMTVAFVVFRTPLEIEYRNYFNKIHCIVDQQRMNSLYDNTIGTYGVDNVLNDRKIYIVKNDYKMTDFYAEYFFKIYDKTYKGNKIIFINDLSELENGANKDNSIVLIEDWANNAYKKVELDNVF